MLYFIEPCIVLSNMYKYFALGIFLCNSSLLAVRIIRWNWNRENRSFDHIDYMQNTQDKQLKKNQETQ